MNRLASTPLKGHDSPTSGEAQFPLAGANDSDQTTASPDGPMTSLEKSVIHRLFRWLGDPPVSVVYRNDEISPSGCSPQERVVIQDRWTLWKLAIDPTYQFGEAYISGKIVLDGDLFNLISILYRSFNQRQSLLPCLVHRVLRSSSRTVSKSRDNIKHHYDIGNDFYRLWLDERLIYTCAYFAKPSLTLEQAQVAKMNHICRKLRLQPGQVVLEAGCGWGAFALHMAQQFGVTVKAFNISSEQIKYARNQARRRGLDDRVEFIEDDWRNICQPCDAFVSVGMLEHVGIENYVRFGDVIDRCLQPNGIGLIHTIGQNQAIPLNPWIEQRIFPGAYPPTLRQMMGIFETHQFSILDVENLRPHYALTLRHWLDRFMRSEESVLERFDERFVRMWSLYLSGSIAAFETGQLQLYQLLFARAANNDIPWTRDALYKTEASSRDPNADLPLVSADQGKM